MEKLYRCVWVGKSYAEAVSYTTAESEEEAREKFEAHNDRGFEQCYEEGIKKWEILEIEEDEM